MENAEKALIALIGKPMWTYRRAADMAIFQFGPRKQVQDFYGRPTQIGEYALHIQCPWCIVRGSVVAVGSRDLRYPAHYIEGESIPEDFNWERNANRLDSLMQALFEDGTREFNVRHVALGAGGACRIEFDEGMSLEVFPDDSLAHEHWRLFATEDGGIHIVMTGLGRDAV
jgi:hypothetical protein